MVKLRDSSLEQKLLKCCQIELNDEDILSQKGCSDCVERLENCFNFISDVATTQEFLKSSGDQLFIVEFIDNKEDIKILELIPDSEVPIKNTRVTRNRKSTQKTPEEVSDEIKTKPVLRPKATKSPAKPAKSTKAKANKNGKLTKRYEKLRYTMKDIFESELAGAFKHITTLAVPENEKNPNGTLTAEGIKRFSSSNWSSLSWKCSDCENVPFKDLNQLQEHYTSTHKQKIVYLCPFCPKTVTKFSSCFNHITEYHKNFLIYCCQVCDDYRWNFMDLYKHQRKAHPDHKIFMCIYCGKNFHCGSILKDHRICCHGKESEQLGSQKQIGHKCNQCDKTFTLKRNLYNHMQSHLEKQHICDKCGLSFLQKGNLVNHQITHSDLRPFKCLVCSTTFKTIKRLRYHNLVHTKIKAHFCDVCNRSFALRTTLKVHYRIHTQVRFILLLHQFNIN